MVDPDDDSVAYLRDYPGPPHTCLCCDWYVAKAKACLSRLRQARGAGGFCTRFDPSTIPHQCNECDDACILHEHKV